MMESLLERAAVFEACMDNARDEHGFVYSDLNADTMKPWTDEELKDAGADIWSNWAHDPSGCRAYEDTMMATGRYVSMKILKHLLADGGDEAALIDATGGVEALLALSREGDKVEDGFLPKPFGGLEKATQSTGISNDQYEHALFAVWRFRQACPDSPLVGQIDSAIVRWTEYFLRRDWSYLFHGLHWVNLEPLNPTDYPEEVLVHTLGLYIPMCVMSHEITGDKKYLDELHYRLAPVLRRWNKSPLQRFTGHSNSCELQGMGLYFCWKKGYLTDETRRGLEHCWEITAGRLSSDWLEYDIPGVTDDNKIEPKFLDKSFMPGHGDLRGLWVSNEKTPCSMCSAHTGTLLQRVEPDPARAETIQHILHAVRCPTDVALRIDPDGKQVPPEFKFETKTVWIQIIGAWLQAYYMTQLSGSIDGL